MKKLYSIAIALIFCIPLFSQTNYDYIVDPIPFQVFQEQDVIQFNGDDTYSDVIYMPFPFDFYDNLNNSALVVGSNGGVTFDLTVANTFNGWVISDTDLIPNTTLPNPEIFGAYHDIDNSVAVTGGVYTGVTGNFPNRRFHIVFEDIPQFSCNDLFTTMQIVLHETSGIIDIVIIDKPTCSAWNGGNAVIGLNGGAFGIAAPGRNTGDWTTQEEAWRFIPTSFFDDTFNVLVCDIGNDGTETFDLSVYRNEILSRFNLDPAENTIGFYNDTNQLVDGLVTIIPGNNIPENTYNIVINETSDNQVFDLKLAFIDCGGDSDTDGLPDDMEDTNGNGNLADDDTDGDGIPDYLDDDDDGDTVLTDTEIVFNRNTNDVAFLDTDQDGIYDHLDFDDDDDGILTVDEDYNGNGDPTDDDLNMNGIPDYLDFEALSVEELSLNTNLIKLYPNPVTDKLTIEFSSEGLFSNNLITTKIYDYQGRLLNQEESTIVNQRVELNTSKLSSGNYILVIQKGNFTKAEKFIIN